MYAISLFDGNGTVRSICHSLRDQWYNTHTYNPHTYNTHTHTNTEMHKISIPVSITWYGLKTGHKRQQNTGALLCNEHQRGTVMHCAAS